MSRKVVTRFLAVLALVLALGLTPAFAAETGGQGADGATTGDTSAATGDEGASIDPHG